MPRGEVLERHNDQDRVARLVDIVLQLCQYPRQYNRADLAERYGVSERQITKDLQLLRDRLHLRIERDPDGRGYYLASIPRLPALQLSLSEALALLLAAQAGHVVPGVSTQELNAALARLRAVLPEPFRELLAHVAHIRPPGSLDANRRKRLHTLLEAMALRHTVEIVYRTASRGGDRVRRQFDPYGIVPFGRSWYVIGWCHLRRAIRTFKVDRMDEIRDTRYPFEIRPEFSLRDFLTANWGIFDAPGLPAEEVELEFSRTAAPWIAEEEWHPTQEIESLPDGGIRFRVRVPITPDFVRWVLNYGVEVTVVRPEALREQILAHARGILHKYGARESAQTEAAGAAQ